MKIAILIGGPPHEAEELQKNVERHPQKGTALERGFELVEPTDLYPSQATADRAYRMRDATDSLEKETERWQDQGKRACRYEDDFRQADKLSPEKALDPLKDA